MFPIDRSPQGLFITTQTNFRNKRWNHLEFQLAGGRAVEYLHTQLRSWTGPTQSNISLSKQMDFKLRTPNTIPWGCSPRNRDELCDINNGIWNGDAV